MIAAVPRGEVFLPDWIAGFSEAGIPRIITLFKLVFRFFRKKTKKSFEIHLTNEKIRCIVISGNQDRSTIRKNRESELFENRRYDQEDHR